MSGARLHFNNMPDEILIEIILNLIRDGAQSPEQLARLWAVSTRMKNVVADPLFWKPRVLTHFPTLFRKHVNDENADWQNIFVQEYVKAYQYLTNSQKRLITALKENDFNVVKQLNPSFDTLIAEVSHNGVATPFVLCTKDKKIHHYLYRHIILPHYKNSNWYIWDGENQRSIFYWALACQLNFDHIDDLLKLGITPLNQTCFSTKETLLHLAAAFGRKDIAQLLIQDYGFALNAVNTENKTALFSAARNGKTNVLRYLKSKGMDLSVITPYNLLSDAAIMGHNNALRYLLSQNTNPLLGADIHGGLAIHYAANEGHLDCVKTLIEHDNKQLDTTTLINTSAIFCAATYGHANVVAYLLEQGANISLKVNARSPANLNKTAIMVAADNKHADVIALLLNAGEDFNALINYLLSTDNGETLAKLITLEPNRFDQACKDALLLKAVIAGKLQITAALLAKQANGLQIDSNNYALIHLAALHGHTQCVKKLVEHDATQIDTPYINANSAVNGKTALFFAQEAGDISSVDFILSKMNEKQLFDALVFALRQQERSIIEKIIQLKPIILTRRDEQNKTPLMIADDLKYKDGINILFKNNVFEEADPAVFMDMESHNRMNGHITQLNETLKINFVKDVELMIDTQNLLQILNSATILPNVKLMAIDTYHDTHHTLSTAKYALCIAAVCAIGLSVMLACFVAGAIIGALATSWSGPGAGLGALWGAVSGLSYGWKIGIGLGGAVVGFGAEQTLLMTNNFFARTLEHKELEHAADEMTEFSKKVIQLKKR